MDQEITLRRASMDDMEEIYKWRNSPETRQYSFDGTVIPWKTHKKWFEKIIESSDSIILIGEIHHTGIGVLRYDYMESNKAEVSVNLAPGCSGRGLGTRLLKAGMMWLESHTNIRKIVAEIIPQNIPSLRAFHKAGFSVTMLTVRLS